MQTVIKSLGFWQTACRVIIQQCSGLIAEGDSVTVTLTGGDVSYQLIVFRMGAGTEIE